MTRRFNARAVLLVVVALLLASCAENAPQDALDPQGYYARLTDRLWNPVLAIAVGVFVLVQSLVLYAVLRYRQKSDDDSPPQIHGNAKMELGWTIVPAVILAGVGVLTVGTLFELDERPAAESLDVTVTGHQWWWEYEYPDTGVITANTLVMPAGEPVDITLTSEDVMHNFWVPKLAGKVYAIPGRLNHLVLQADRPGRYVGQCAEFCGLSHANMHLEVLALSRADFDKWLSDQRSSTDSPEPSSDPAAPPAAQGAALFQAKGCAACHTVGDVSRGEIGPNLTKLYGKNPSGDGYTREHFAGALFELNDQNMRRWLRNPPEEKPGSLMPNLRLTDDEINKLMAYLKTLD